MKQQICAGIQRNNFILASPHKTRPYDDIRQDEIHNSYNRHKKLCCCCRYYTLSSFCLAALVTDPNMRVVKEERCGENCVIFLVHFTQSDFWVWNELKTWKVSFDLLPCMFSNSQTPRSTTWKLSQRVNEPQNKKNCRCEKQPQDNLFENFFRFFSFSHSSWMPWLTFELRRKINFATHNITRHKYSNSNLTHNHTENSFENSSSDFYEICNVVRNVKIENLTYFKLLMIISRYLHQDHIVHHISISPVNSSEMMVATNEWISSKKICSTSFTSFRCWAAEI